MTFITKFIFHFDIVCLLNGSRNALLLFCTISQVVFEFISLFFCFSCSSQSHVAAHLYLMTAICVCVFVHGTCPVHSPQRESLLHAIAIPVPHSLTADAMLSVCIAHCQEYQFILKKKSRFANCITRCYAFDERSLIFGFGHKSTLALIPKMIWFWIATERKRDIMQQHVSYRVRKLLRFCVFDEWAI